MNVLGASPIRIVDQPSGQPVEFRINQRISAEILRVSGDQVSMVVQGQQVVGKVTGGDQSGLLSERQAQFVVRGMVDGVLQLQVVKPDSSQQAVSLTNQWTILAQNLIKLIKMPLTDETLMMGKALLSTGLPITAELVENMQTALSELSTWGQAEADLSASLLARGVPLSSGSLNLALQQLPNMVDAFQKLQTRLESWLQNNTSAGLRPLVQKALQVLQGATVDWSASPAELVKQLTQAVTTLGKSMESMLADIAKSGGTLHNPSEANGLLAFAFLRQGLEKEGQLALVKDIDRFVDGLRQMQLVNSSMPKDSASPAWMLVNIPLTSPEPNDQEMKSANLKVAYRQEEGGKVIDGANNRIVLTIDLGNDNSMEVDLSMVDKRVGAWLSVPDSEWQGLFEAEIPEFKKNLEDLGYQIQFAKCDIKATASILPAVRNSTKIDIAA